MFLISCGGSEKSTDNSQIKIEESIDKNKKSSITREYVIKSNDVNKLLWTGSAVGKSHYGTVNFDGYISVEDGNLKKGEILFDLTSISSEDLTGDWKTKLDNHLKDTAFFFTDKYPTATLMINKFDGTNITGELKIKEITKEITFPAEVVVEDSTFSSTSNFTIDRTEYGIVYGSENFFDLAKDKVISDEINFSVTINVKNSKL